MTLDTPPVRFNPFTPQFRDDPYPLYRQLRDRRPVLRTLGMWVVSRHHDVENVLRSRDFGAGLIPQLVARQAHRLGVGEVSRISRLGASSLVFTDNPQHARLRALVNRVFTARAVAALRPRIEHVADLLVERAWARGGFDVVADLATPLPIAVLGDWMDLPPSLRSQVGGWTHDIRFLLEPGMMGVEDFTRVREVVEVFTAALSDLVEHRRAHPGEDLVSRLLTARTGGGDRLGTEEIVFVCMMCFVAGNETTRALVGNGLLALLGSPGPGLAPDTVPGAVRETLRYDSPLQMTKRLALRDTWIGGQEIRAGDEVLLCLGSANRDEQVFDDPDTFDVVRDTRRHLAFGHGMHGCLGGALAQTQTEVLYTELVSRPERLTLVAAPRRWQDSSFIVRGLSSLPVEVHG